MAIKPAGLFGRFMMVAFWILAVALAPAWLTITYLALAVIALYLISLTTGIAFGELIGNDNWVFCAALSMSLVSMLLAIKNPYLPQATWEAFRKVPYNPYAGDSVLGKLNHFYFGQTFTHGWRSAAWIYAFLTIIAIFISFTDDLRSWLADDGFDGRQGEWKRHLVARSWDAILRRFFGRQ